MMITTTGRPSRESRILAEPHKPTELHWLTKIDVEFAGVAGLSAPALCGEWIKPRPATFGERSGRGAVVCAACHNAYAVIVSQSSADRTVR